MPGTNTIENHRRLQELINRRAGQLLLEGLNPPRESFDYPAGTGVEACLAVSGDGPAVAVLVSEDLKYRGGDEALQRLFRSAATGRGWRLVMRLQGPTTEDVLRYLDALLGLDGQPPRLFRVHRRPRERDIVVPTEGQEDRREDRRGEGDQFGEDLVERARRGELTDVVGREREVESLVRIVSKRMKNTACLVGPPGVGKTAIVEKLAIRIAAGEVPKTLSEARLIEVNLGFLAAGASYHNEFEGRFKKLLDMAREDARTILFFDEVHVLCSSKNDASQLVKQDLGRGRIKVIGATTNLEWRTIEADAALARRFQFIPVAEPTIEETIQILARLRERIARHHGVDIPDELLPAIVDLSVRYVSDRRLPDKAIDLLDEAAAYAAMHRAVQQGSPTVVAQPGAAPGSIQHTAPARAEDINAAITAAIARGDYARAYELDARRRQGGAR